MSASVTPAKVLVAIALALASLLISWICLANLLADLSGGPRTAMVWSTDSVLMAQAAQEDFLQAGSEAQFAAVSHLAKNALTRGPLENTALLVLALDADRRGDHARAGAMMSVLGARSRRDTQVELWLFEQAVEGRRYGQAFTHADVLLRRRRELSELLFPIMTSSLRNEAAIGPLIDLLSQTPSPSWRRDFLATLSEQDDAVAIRVLGLLARRTGIAETEFEPLVSRYVANGDYRRAHQVWASLRPGASGPPVEAPYNGSFLDGAGSPPFNWRTTTSGDGAVSELGAAADGRTALYLQFSLSQRARLVEQLLVLDPGTYRLNWEAMAVDGDPPLTMSWRITCAGRDEIVLADISHSLSGNTWRPFHADIGVPADGCPAQWLRLSNRPQDSFAPAHAWYSRIAIHPLAVGESSETAS